MRHLAHFVSSIFQPLLMPVYSVALLFIYTHFRIIFAAHFWYILLPAIIFSFAFPALTIYALYKMRLISDLSLKRRNERFLPYFFTLISYSFMIYKYYRMGMPLWFLFLVASPLLVIVLAMLITLRWKISAHMFGVGGLIGGSMAVAYFVERSNPFYMFMGMFMVAGLVGTSRLLLRRHTLYQVYAGFLLGALITFLFVWIGVI